MEDPSSTIPFPQQFTASSGLVGPEILLSLAVPPVLFGLACAHTLGESIVSLGIASEEIFRGVSLPLLPIQQPPSQSENPRAKS